MPLYNFQLEQGLAQSFQSAQHLLVANGIRFGSDAVFTYGPLGFLAFPQLYYPKTSLLATLAITALVFAVSWVSFWCLRHALTDVAALVATYGVLILGWDRLMNIDWLPESAACLVTVMCLLIISRHRDQATPYMPLELTAILFGILSAVFLLVKASTGIQVAAVSASTIAIVSSPTVRPTWRVARTVVIWLSSALLSGIVAWVGLGQRLGDIPTFFRYSVELAGGYAGAMGIERSASGAEYGTAVLLIVGLAVLLVSRWGLKELKRNPVLVVPVILYVFTAFKHGFVRHDRHSMVFFLTVALLALAFITRETFITALLVFGMGLLAAWGVVGFSAAALNPFSHLGQSAEVAAAVVDASHRDSAIAAARVRARQGIRLSDETVELLAGHRVHADPWDAGILWAYPEFKWGAPPVFQTYAAFTAGLDELNAGFLRSDRAPEYILRRAQAIDGRHPAFESPAYMVEMACRYDEVDTDGSWSVLERTTPECGTLESVSHSTVGLGDWVSVPDTSRCDGWMVLTVDGLSTTAQRLQVLLYKDATYWLTFDSGERYRLIPGTAVQPHLLPDESSPPWLGSALATPNSHLSINRTGFPALAPETLELDFGCLNRSD